MADGIPAQLKRFNERLDRVEDQQRSLQRVIDDEVIPAAKTAEAKADAAIETASKALATAQARPSRKVDRRRRKPSE